MSDYICTSDRGEEGDVSHVYTCHVNEKGSMTNKWELESSKYQRIFAIYTTATRLSCLSFKMCFHTAS
jgi:hypothetical protein